MMVWFHHDLFDVAIREEFLTYWKSLKFIDFHCIFINFQYDAALDPGPAPPLYDGMVSASWLALAGWLTSWLQFKLAGVQEKS